MPHRLAPSAASRRVLLLVCRCLLALLAMVMPAASHAAALAGAAVTPLQASAPRPQAAQEMADSGSFHRAKVRILGIPVLTVASPVVAGARGPDARQRARVIEGNLELLYRGQEVCTAAESIGEQIVATLLHRLDAGERSCDANQLGLLAGAGQLRVEIGPGSGELPVLQARVPGRELPLPLLSVTNDDARLNGTTAPLLAERWRGLLERRLRLARHLLEPGVLGQRFRAVALAELVLLGLLAIGLLLWRVTSHRLEALELEVAAMVASGAAAPAPALPTEGKRRPGSLRNRARRLLRRHLRRDAGGLRHALTITGLHLLSRVLLGAVLLLLPLMVGVIVLAVPGQIPLAIELLLQPFGVVAKLAIGWLMAQLLKTVLGVLLSQWHSNPVLAPERRARRDQRYRSLLRVMRRLVTLLCAALVALWVLVDVPGVRDLSNNALLASGALLGALALVFQDLLRDFVAGLMVLLEDRYAIGDQISVDDMKGEVIDVDLLSIELRSADQRVMVIPNSQCKRVINATKLRSGQELHLTLAHHGADPRRALAVIEQTALAFAADPAWAEGLLEPPRLLGLRQVSPLGLELALVVVTRAGRQGSVERELLLRLVEALRAEGIALADAAQPAVG